MLLAACSANTADEQSYLENKIRCIEFGKEHFLDEDRYNRYYRQVFTYSSSLDTCLYYYHFSLAGSDDRGIKDMLSDKLIAAYIGLCRTKDCTDSEKEDETRRLEEFIDIYDKYFR